MATIVTKKGDKRKTVLDTLADVEAQKRDFQKQMGAVSERDRLNKRIVNPKLQKGKIDQGIGNPIDAAMRYIEAGTHMSDEVRNTLIKGMQENPRATTQHIVQDHIVPFITNTVKQGSQAFEQLPAQTQAFVREFLKDLPQITQVYANENPGMGYKNNIHSGTDFGTKVGTPLMAPKGNWTVVDSYSGAGTGRLGDWTNQGYGNSVVIQNEKGEKMRLSHLQNTPLKTGQVVTGGTVIGTTGNSGNSSAEHLDIEYYDKNGALGDVTKNPMIKEVFVKGETPNVDKAFDTGVGESSKKLVKLGTKEEEKTDTTNPFVEKFKPQNDVGKAFTNAYGQSNSVQNSMQSFPSANKQSAPTQSFGSTPAKSAPASQSSSSSSSSASKSSSSSSSGNSTSNSSRTSSPQQSVSAPKSTYNAPTAASTYGGNVKQSVSTPAKSSSSSSSSKSAPAKSNPVSNIVNAVKRFFGW